MGISAEEKSALQDLLKILELKTQGGRSKRFICTIFMDLPDKENFQDYYNVIPKPRSVKMVKQALEEDQYEDSFQFYNDLSLVFYNAIYYNEEGSQIWNDANKLQWILDQKWDQNAALPQPRSTSPPPESAQKLRAKPSKRERTRTFKTESPAPGQVSSPASGQQAMSATPVASRSYQPAAPTPLRQASVDMDVDVSGGSEQGDPGDESFAPGTGNDQRDPESEQIVRQLEKGLPRWPGFGEGGWWECDDPGRFDQIVHAIKSYKDVINNKFSVALDAVPEEAVVPHLASNSPISLKIIDTKARSASYANSKEFDQDFARLFDKARKYHEPQSEAYGSVLLLQRLYNALTSANPPSGPPYTSATKFASLAAGPGHTKPVHSAGYAQPDAGIAGVTSHRVVTKDRHFVDELDYKGWNFKLADWVHLANPDDPARPIPGQIFRLWIDTKGERGITVAWYFRPEQTFHPAHRTFWTNEIFKTSHFASHPLPDIIEKIAVQFTARHIRGRPRPPFYYPGFPLYVCDSRYNDRDRIFVRIKNWSSCVPEEVRKKEEWMAIWPFERPVYPVRHPSPFLSGGTGGAKIRGPGGIADPVPGAAGVGEGAGGITGVGGDESWTPSVRGGDGPPRKRTKRNQGMGDLSGPTRGAYVGTIQQQQQQQQQPQQQQQYYQQPAQFTVPPTTGQSPGPQFAAAVGLGGAYGASGSGPGARTPAGVVDRSITSNLGAWKEAKMDILKLPSELTRHFDRDPTTGEMLWFPSPPLNSSHVRLHHPKYSMNYLHFIATKEDRKRKRDDTKEEEEEEQQKMPPTMQEILWKIETESGEGKSV